MKTTSGVLSESMIKLLNYRVEQEEYASRLYMAMSIWLDDKGFTGVAKLLKQYSDEEISHANKAKNTLLANGISPTKPVLKRSKQEIVRLAERFFDISQMGEPKCFLDENTS